MVACTAITSYVCIRCVPSQSTATIKLELLPLTDGIITLDSLQIGVKEKGTQQLIPHNWFFDWEIVLYESMNYFT